MGEVNPRPWRVVPWKAALHTGIVDLVDADGEYVATGLSEANAEFILALVQAAEPPAERQVASDVPAEGSTSTSRSEAAHSGATGLAGLAARENAAWGRVDLGKEGA